MTADYEVVLGVTESSKAKIDMSLDQDPLLVSADCNGTKLDDVVYVNVGNDNVSSVGNSCVVTTIDALQCDNNSGEGIVVLDSKALDLQYEKVIQDIVQSLVKGETCSATQECLQDVNNGTELKEHEYGQLMVEDDSDVGVNDSGIVESVDDTEKEVLSEGKDNDLRNDDELKQPNVIITDIEEHCKVEVEDIAQYLVINETSSVSMSAQMDMQNGTDVEEHKHRQLMMKDKSEVGVNNREIVEPVDEYHSLSQVNDLHDKLDQPNGIITCSEEHCKVEVEDPKAGEVTSEEEVVSNGKCVLFSDLCNGEVNSPTDTVRHLNETEEKVEVEDPKACEVTSEEEVVSNGKCVSFSDLCNREVNSPTDTVHHLNETEEKVDVEDPKACKVDSAPVLDIVCRTREHCESRLLSQTDDVGHEIENTGDNGTNIAALLGIQFGSFRQADKPKDVVRGENGDVVVIGDDKPESNTLEISTNKIIASSYHDSADVMDTLRLVDEAATKPFRFIVKVPRFDDEKVREQLRTAQLRLDEKTHQRDSVHIEVQKKRNDCQVLDKEYRDARSEEIAAKKLLKLKRQEIDSVQVLINRVKNAITVGNMDCKISGLKHKIEHETHSIKEEKLLLREIKQTKLLRDQLFSNMGSQDEVKQAFDQRDHIEGGMMILKKELDVLKGGVSKAEAATSLLRNNYDDENEKLKALHAQFKNANDVRQEAYKHFSAMKGELKEKSKHFWMYKDAVRAANDSALRGDKEALHNLCVNQVETMMKLWNSNDAFHKQYVRCNMKSTVRRFKTLDGRSPGPDEEALVLPNYADLRVNSQLSRPGMATSPSVVPTQRTPVPPVKEEVVDGKSIKVAEVKNHPRKREAAAQPILGSGCSETVLSKVEIREAKVDENMQMEEQLDIATKAETLMEKERDEELKEKRCLEEKAKALEALERKKRTAEKARIKAEIRAQKEAEQKQKEKEKRLRKKERKNSAVVDAQMIDSDGECSTALELPNEIAKESVVKENSAAAVKRPKEISTSLTKQSKLKVIPPPLRNKGKRKWKQAVWWIIVIAVILFVIFGGEGGAFGESKSQKSTRR